MISLLWNPIPLFSAIMSSSRSLKSSLSRINASTFFDFILHTSLPCESYEQLYILDFPNALYTAYKANTYGNIYHHLLSQYLIVNPCSFNFLIANGRLSSLYRYPFSFNYHNSCRGLLKYAQNIMFYANSKTILNNDQFFLLV